MLTSLFTVVQQMQYFVATFFELQLQAVIAIIIAYSLEGG